jgi:uncharacterized protein YndB with AHSA1/START domain
MTTAQEQPRVVSASREIPAGPGRIFELIADPAQQPRWDGNDNLAGAPAGQRVRHTGEVFTMTLTHDGAIRENHVVEFEEGRRIAWRPAEPGKRPPGHLWRWELEPAGASRTRVTCTYDWTQLTDQNRFRRARRPRPTSSGHRLTGSRPSPKHPDRPPPRGGYGSTACQFHLTWTTPGRGSPGRQQARSNLLAQPGHSATPTEQASVTAGVRDSCGQL